MGARRRGPGGRRRFKSSQSERKAVEQATSQGARVRHKRNKKNAPDDREVGGYPSKRKGWKDRTKQRHQFREELIERILAEGLADRFAGGRHRKMPEQLVKAIQKKVGPKAQKVLDYAQGKRQIKQLRKKLRKKLAAKGQYHPLGG